MTNRHAQFGDDIYADADAYWWSWNQRIAALGNPAAAAQKISTVLATTPQPAHG